MTVQSSRLDTRYAPVARLRPGSSPRRTGISPDHVESLMTSVDQWPPLLVQRDDLVVIDGHHRLAAASALGLTALPVEWFDGSATDACIEAIRRNVDHGLPLTLQERRAAATRVARDRPEWSDSLIGDVCGLSPKTIARLRMSTAALPVPPSGQRLGRDGRCRPTDPRSRRTLIEQALAGQPGASLRQIASQLGVSHETVRTVRRELMGPDRQRPPNEDDASRSAWPSFVAGNEGVDEHKAVTFGEDTACQSTDEGKVFASWFDAHNFDGDVSRLAAAVPLSRLYQVIDECRHRAECWSQLAAALHARLR